MSSLGALTIGCAMPVRWARGLAVAVVQQTLRLVACLGVCLFFLAACSFASPFPSATAVPPASVPTTMAVQTSPTRSPSTATVAAQRTPASSPVPATATRPPATASVQATAAPAAKPAPVDVFFSRRPQSDNDFTAVFPVQRTAPAGSEERLAASALEQLVAGPTAAEQAQGFYSELGGMLRGPSSCGGPAFTLRISEGTATMRLCRAMSSAGIGQDARTRSQIDATLRQFGSVRRVVLLTAEGDCLFDMSGLNLCLRPNGTPIR